MASIGFVGLGMMGSRMVRRLMDAGHQVIGFNRTTSKAEPLVQRGMQLAATPKDVALAADIILTNVSDDNSLNLVTEGADGILAGLSAGKVYLVMSTVSPALIQDLNKRVEAVGAHLLDAPVSGSKLTLEQGKLTVLVAGNEAIFQKVKPVLEVIGPTVLYIGDSGQAMALKIAINMSIATQIVTFIEGVLLAEEYGVSRKQAVEVMLNTAIASPALKYRGPFVAEMPDEAWFDVSMMQKDLSLALDLSRDLNVALPTTSIANDLLSEARRLGYADKDFAILVKVLEAMSGQQDVSN